MKPMYRRSILTVAALLAALGLLFGAFSISAQDNNKRGRKYKAPPPTSTIKITVLKDFNGKPIENAAVIFHTVNESGNMELKSDEDGMATIDVLPIGDTMRLQIIAHGYQTYGADYKIDSDNMAIDVRMKRPGEQYSIYKPHPAENQKKDQSTVEDNGKKDQDKDKPSDSSKPQ
jgi:hypothetical protein